MDASPTTPRRVGVLLAGGVGARVGLDRPKQLVELHGRTILEHSLRGLHDHDLIDEVVVVMAPGHLDVARSVAAAYDKVTAVLPGGSTRTQSTLAALAHLGEADCHVLFHDAARPLLPRRVVTDCLTALGTYAAVATAVPSTDTLLEVGPERTLRSVPPRDSLQRAQTPQGFHAEVLRRAYEVAAGDPGFVATDDCSVVHRYLPDVPVAVVAGDERTLKVTTKLDLVLVEALMRLDEEG
ncbi:2-C-methyl-D-erythritol 4-phosphate cytidylyltransferase [Nocardioides euryhalodurans]|uniref:2-C-methyl-D-erythritol 4-phosphate cytidylyltransferase n=1 Tax=Nocardioides euryhalodurans TaxID=2518370 RepID=A0A4P7GKK4_9ACTN|nr:2-C-methyl-D-erythritol 4-phosphate cytidylyltransferase [Nocardioides euryhalodurans]QBR92565.1 2-C-methyl-D-erythritol 4-phosphate cytidylyltransferase [Nocardioides euryhalodurans]